MQQAIVHGDPPTLPDTGYSDEAHAFVRACLDKIPKNRPSYNMLLRHPWLSPLMRPPSEVEGEMAPQPAEDQAPGSHPSSYMTQDKEVAEWVHKQLERCQNGQLQEAKKPALHAVALDKVATSPIHDESPSTAKAN